MEKPNSPLYLTTLEVIANILIRLWLVIGVLMANNNSQSILDSLLFTASNQWGISKEQIMENMNKIAFHESKGNPSAIQKSDKTKSGIGPGRGLFQFEVGGEQGAHTAINRLTAQIEKMNKEEGVNIALPGFIQEMKDLEGKNIDAWDSAGYDVSVLSPEQQQMMFLGNLLQMPHKKGEGYGKASFAGIDTDEELAEYWAQYHQAGTKPGTDEYDRMLDKFTEDVQFYK